VSIFDTTSLSRVDTVLLIAVSIIIHAFDFVENGSIELNSSKFVKFSSAELFLTKSILFGEISNSGKSAKWLHFYLLFIEG